ncbi:MAG: DUF484 family protein [Gammaproteobacteria bacterium]|nr:DUF484 family protein [Gammaproteobacteria bacterium]
MSKQTLTEKAEVSGSREELVRRFLEETPDYFLNHPELLAALVLPHPESGRAVSLVERQVRVLRDRSERLARELGELLGIARDNDQLSERVQRFALAMIDADSLDDALDTGQDMLRQEFSLDGVVLRLSGNPRPVLPRAEFVAVDDAVLAGMQNHIGSRGGQTVCGPLSDTGLLNSIFGAGAAEIGSTALVPLTRRGLNGVLALGSREPGRFRPDMGTVYLQRLGDLLLCGVARHLINER